MKLNQSLLHNVGDGLVASSVFLSGTAFASENIYLEVASIACGAVGMFLQKAFKDKGDGKSN